MLRLFQITWIHHQAITTSIKKLKRMGKSTCYIRYPTKYLISKIFLRLQKIAKDKVRFPNGNIFKVSYYWAIDIDILKQI